MGRKPFNPDLAVGGKEAATPMANRKAAAREHLTVWQLTQQIKDAIESCLPSTVHVVGQLSNVKHHSSGHLYFTLKDDRSEIACVAWRSVASKLKFTPSDGMDVLASGSVSVFERSGRYQLYVRSLAPQGIGALELAFRQLCEKLKDEGLFDTHRKRELPRYPQRVAVITSPSGAALHDILDTLRRRYACAEVVFCPVAVQGAGAAGAIARAIRRVNREATPLGGIDVMIVGRGGGSIEDLWAFNEEVVARAIYASAIPVISAVGHESDVTIADFVADVRAATPTAAAELAVPQSGEVADELTYLFSAMARSMRHRIDLGKARLAAAAERAMLSDPARLLRERSARLDILSSALTSRVGGQQSYLRRRMAELALVLERLAPERFLAEMRGVVRVRGHRLTMALSRGLARCWTTCGGKSAVHPAIITICTSGPLSGFAGRTISTHSP